MAEQYSIVYVYHTFFIHSFVDRNLGFILMKASAKIICRISLILCLCEPQQSREDGQYLVVIQTPFKNSLCAAEMFTLYSNCWGPTGTQLIGGVMPL